MGKLWVKRTVNIFFGGGALFLLCLNKNGKFLQHCCCFHRHTCQHLIAEDILRFVLLLFQLNFCLAVGELDK